MGERAPIRPLSLLHGRDNEAIPLLLALHAVENPIILDATHNKGVMWKGLKHPDITVDIDPQYNTTLVADFANIPLPDKHVDVIVFDPPHLPTNAASTHSSKIWESRYGITSAGRGRMGDNVSGMFMPFLFEAKRLLRPDGIVLAKLADIIHNHKYQWHHVDFINDARAVGMTPCDLLVKADPNAGKLMSSKWKNVHHLRKAHCYWIVIRNSNRCERKKDARS